MYNYGQIMEITNHTFQKLDFHELNGDPSYHGLCLPLGKHLYGIHTSTDGLDVLASFSTIGAALPLFAARVFLTKTL